jgi:NAD(P)-dependent dehydrogenase (short-subunit alcohol dehydrogenase family)
MERLKDKVAIITGSSSGLGRAIAIKFASEGAKVVCSDVRRKPDPQGFEDDKGVPTDDAIRQKGLDVVFVSCDVTKQTQVKGLVQAAVNTFGKLDIMVNNAGVYRAGKAFHEMTEADLDVCLGVNVKGMFFGSQEAVKQFLKRGKGGNIVNIISVAGLGAYPFQSVYNISKAAAANLTSSLAVEYGQNGIRVNGICPTFCKTSMTRSVHDDAAFSEMFVKEVPLGRWGEADDVADLALFLASEESRFIHGDLIRVDGGQAM